MACLLLSGNAQAQSSDGTGKDATASSQSTSGSKTESPLKKTFQEMYDRCVAATKKKDETVLAKLRATDYTFVDLNKKSYTRSEVEENERRAMQQMKSIESVNSTVRDVKVESKSGRQGASSTSSQSLPTDPATLPVGTLVTATLHQEFAGTVIDLQQKSHKFTYNSDTRDVWIQTREGWKLQSVTVIGRNETRDGKTFNPDASANNGGNNNSGSNRSNHSNSGQHTGHVNSGTHRSTGHTGTIKMPKMPKMPHFSPRRYR